LGETDNGRVAPGRKQIVLDLKRACDKQEERARLIEALTQRTIDAETATLTQTWNDDGSRMDMLVIAWRP